MGSLNTIWEMPEKFPGLPKNTIHLWRIVVADFEGYLEKFEGLLNATEKQKFNQFKYQNLKINFLVCRGALRYLLSMYMNETPKDIKLKTTPDGKPFLAEDHHAKIAFNISHTRADCLIALSRTYEVGVDIELIKPLPNLKDMAASYLTVSELRNFNCLSPDEQLARFYLLWTAKEALLKAIGCGLMIHPGQINVEEIYSEKKLTIEDRSNLIELPAITLAKLSISEGYAAWMAYIGESARIACYLLTQNLVSM